MNISKWFAENIWYIQIGIAFVSLINFPVNMLQFIMISHITFPGVTLPNQVPWWLFMGTVVASLFVMLWVIGIIYTRKNFVKHQTDIANRNNPQMLAILLELEEIKRRITVTDYPAMVEISDMIGS